MNIDQIAMCYKSIYSSQRGLQTNVRAFFSNFKLVFEIMIETEKYSKGVNADQSAMYYISMDLT